MEKDTKSNSAETETKLNSNLESKLEKSQKNASKLSKPRMTTFIMDRVKMIDNLNNSICLY